MQVSLALLVSSLALLLLQGCCTAVKGWKVLKNDGTEILPEYRENSRTPLETILQTANGNNNNNNNNTLNNRAKSGGRSADTVSYSKYYFHSISRLWKNCVTGGTCEVFKCLFPGQS